MVHRPALLANEVLIDDIVDENDITHDGSGANRPDLDTSTMNYHAIESEEEEEDNDDYDDDDYLMLKDYRKLLKTKPWVLRPTLISISIVTLMFGLATAASVPSKVSIIYKLACHSITEPNGVCDPIQTQLIFTKYSLINDVLGNFITLFALGIVGDLSDKYGRRKFFIGYSITLLFSELIRFWALKHYNYINYWLLIPAIFFQSTFGGMNALYAFANAYVNDICEADEKIAHISWVNASLPIGQLAGTIFSKVLLAYYRVQSNSPKADLNYTNEFVPLIFELILLSLLAIYCIFILPESRCENSMLKSRRFTILSPIVTPSSFYKKYLNQVKKIFKPLRLLTLPRELITSTNYNDHTAIKISFMILVAIAILSEIASSATATVFIQYSMLMFQLLAEDLSNIMLLITITSIFVMAVLTPFLSNFVFPKIFKFKVLKHQLDLIDYSILLLGSVFGIIGNMLFSIANSIASIVIAIILFLFCTMTTAPATSSLLKFIPDSKTGEFFAAKTLLQNTISVGVPLLIQLFYQFMLVRNLVQQIFVYFAGLLVLGFLGLIIVKHTLKLTKDTTDENWNHRDSLNDQFVD